MQPISTDTFLERAKAAGIGYDPRYPDAGSLVFLPPNEHSRFWLRPEHPAQWPHFVASLLDAAGARGSVLVCPRRGWWPDLSTARDNLGRTNAMLSTALGVPPGWRGGLQFDAGDHDRLVAILVTQFLRLFNDLYVLLPSAPAFLEFSHHDVVHVSCATREGIESAVNEMAAAGYALPDEPPDATFKPPPWMRPPAGA
jgi:hypothetical protein